MCLYILEDEVLTEGSQLFLESIAVGTKDDCIYLRLLLFTGKILADFENSEFSGY